MGGDSENFGGDTSTTTTSTVMTQFVQVQFTDTSSGADSVLWDFGDDSTATERNPMHTYTENGD